MAPTVLSVAGRSPPADADGRDLTELLDGDEPPWAGRDVFLSIRTTGPGSNLVRGVVRGSHKYLRRSRPTASESLYDLARDPPETDDLASERAETRDRLAATLDAYVGERSSGIHVRIVNDPVREPVDCEARLRTTGRFVDVTKVRLEKGDGFERSDDGRTLRLGCRLENRFQSTTAGPRLIPDEDGLVFRVRPPDASVVVEHLGLADGTELPLRAGTRRALEETPFTFDATNAAWSVRDVDAMLGDAAGAYLGVIRMPAEGEDVPEEILDRLRALGYATDTDAAAPGVD